MEWPSVQLPSGLQFSCRPNFGWCPLLPMPHPVWNGEPGRAGLRSANSLGAGPHASPHRRVCKPGTHPLPTLSLLFHCDSAHLPVTVIWVHQAPAPSLGTSPRRGPARLSPIGPPQGRPCEPPSLGPLLLPRFAGATAVLGLRGVLWCPGSLGCLHGAQGYRKMGALQGTHFLPKCACV